MVSSDAVQSVILVIIAFLVGVPVIHRAYFKPLQCWNCGAETARPHVPRIVQGAFCEECRPVCTIAAQGIEVPSDRDREEAALASRMGVSAFLVKPVRQAALFKAIAQVFGEVSPSQPPTAVAEQRQLRGRVLVAEDNATSQKVIVMRLTRLGCVVDVANDGLEAVGAASTTAYDLILMDCQMPVMDGFEATRAIRERGGRRVPVVALTANAMEGERERCLDAGMDDYLAKPMRPADLVAKLHQWLGVEPSALPAPSVQVASAMQEQLDASVDELKEAQTAREDIDSLLRIVIESTPPRGAAPGGIDSAPGRAARVFCRAQPEGILCDHRVVQFIPGGRISGRRLQGAALAGSRRTYGACHKALSRS